MWISCVISGSSNWSQWEVKRNQEAYTLVLVGLQLLKFNFCSSPAKSSSSEDSFGVLGSWQEKYPSFSGVRVNMITPFCPRVKSSTGSPLLLSGVLTKKFAFNIGNVFFRHLNVMALFVRSNVSVVVHLPNVQNNNRTRTTNPAWYLLAAITCSSTQDPKSRTNYTPK